MKTKFSQIYLALVVLLLFAGGSPVQATPNDDSIKARNTLIHMRTDIRELRQLLKNSIVLAAVSKSRIAKRLTDSDSDGLPDILESVEHTDACNDDSDNDGINDGLEANQGTDGDDSSEGEVEVTGLISAITSQTVTLAEHTCTATESTEFVDGVSLADYQVGNKVEMTCTLRLINGSIVLTLRRIKFED